MESRQTPHARIREILIWTCVVVGVIFLFLIFMAHNLRAIADVDALDYAQVARNLAEGKGFSSDFIKPLALTRVTRLDHHPDLIFSPLHPALTSLFIRALGANDRAVALASGLPFLITLLLTYFLGLRLFDKRVGIMGTVMFGVYLGTLHYSISGLEVCLLGMWATALFLVLHQLAHDEKHLPWLAAGSGILLGLVVLTKDVWVVMLAPVLLFIWFSVERRRRWATVGIALAAFVLVLAPWCVRAAHLTGNPFFTWRWYESEMQTMTNPGNTLYRSYRPDIQSPLTFVLYHPMEVYDRLLDGALGLYGVLATVAGPFALAFFIVAILVPMGDAVFERLRYVLYATYILLFGALCWIMPSPRLVYPIGPIVAVLGAALFFRILTPLIHRYAPREQTRALGWALGLLHLPAGRPDGGQSHPARQARRDQSRRLDNGELPGRGGSDGRGGRYRRALVDRLVRSPDLDLAAADLG